MIKKFLDFILNTICMGVEIALIAKIIEIVIVTKTSFTLKGFECLFLDCAVIGITTYGLIRDVKEVWEDN